MVMALYARCQTIPTLSKDPIFQEHAREQTLQQLESVLVVLSQSLKERIPICQERLSPERFRITWHEDDGQGSWEGTETIAQVPSVRDVILDATSLFGFPRETGKSLADQILHDLRSGELTPPRFRRMQEESTTEITWLETLPAV